MTKVTLWKNQQICVPVLDERSYITTNMDSIEIWITSCKELTKKELIILTKFFLV
jgi:hypothetical protein